MKITIQALLKPLNQTDKRKLEELCLIYSCAKIKAYKLIIKKYKRNEIYHLLREKFNLHSWYINTAIEEAKAIYQSRIENGLNPKKIIFGGRKLFEKLKKGHKELKQIWNERRYGELCCYGHNRVGNICFKIVDKGDNSYLRISTNSRRNYILCPIKRKVKSKNDKWILFVSKLEEVKLTGKWFSYTIKIKKRNNRFYCFITFDEEIPTIKHTKDNGIIGIDINASPIHIAIAEVSKSGNLISYERVSLNKLLSMNKNQRTNYLWKLAHYITDKAKELNKAIAVENLNNFNKGYRGDGRGKLRKRLHNFIYKNLLNKLEVLCRRKGIEFIKVNPAFTSVIGMLKYAPQYNIDKDIAGAYVIGRRGLGLSEKIPKNYLKLLKNTEYFNTALQVLENQINVLKQKIKQESNKYKLNALKSDLKKLYKYRSTLKSLDFEPSTQQPVNRDGTGEGSQRGYKRWQGVQVTLIFPYLGRSVIRDFSPLKRILVAGDWVGVMRRLAPYWWEGRKNENGDHQSFQFSYSIPTL